MVTQKTGRMLQTLLRHQILLLQGVLPQLALEMDEFFGYEKVIFELTCCINMLTRHC
jgi:hypothetical protein